jgi:hypothetical protein
MDMLLRRLLGEGVSMGFRVPGEDEYAGSGFGTLAPDRYRCTIESYDIKSGEEVTNQYNPKGDERVWFTLRPTAIDGDEDAELVDPEGEPVSEDKTVLFFFDPKRLGLKPQIAKSREFFAAAMKIEVTQPVDFDSLEALCKALVGREVIANIIINPKNGKNAIKGVSPVVQRVRRQRAAAPTGEAPLVAAASAIFDEAPPAKAEPTPIPAEDDDLPF